MKPDTQLDQRHATDRADLAAVVVTSSPQAFVEALAREVGLQVLVCETKDQAIAALERHNCKNVFVDFAEIKTGETTSWTGFRFLRHIRDAAELSGVAVWLMTTAPAFPHTQWAKHLGAAGFVARNPAAVLLQLALGAPTAGPQPNQRSIRLIERAFARLAPTKSAACVTAARRSLAARANSASALDYAAALASELSPNDLVALLLRDAGVSPETILASPA